MDSHLARRIRGGARRRPGSGHGAAADERRVRLRAARSHRGRDQGRHRLLERLGRRRRLRQLRRRPVRAGHHRRAVSRSGQAGGRSRRHRKRPAGLLHGHRQDGSRAVRARPHPAALCLTGIPGGLGRRRPSVWIRSLRQGVLHRLALQAPRGAGRAGGDASRTREPRGDFRALRGAHLERGQPGRCRLPEPRDDRAVARSSGPVFGHPGVRRQGPDRVRQPGEVAGRVAKLVVRARRPGRRGRWRREPARVRRHDAGCEADARLCLWVEPAVRPRRSTARAGPLDRASLGGRASQQPEHDAGGHLAERACGPAPGPARRSR